MPYNSHSERVHAAEYISQRVHEIFGFSQDKYHGKIVPDIFDKQKHCIGEIKAFNKDGKIDLSTPQFRKYQQAARSLDKQRSFEGNGCPWSYAYFFAHYLNTEPPYQLSDIFVIDEKGVENFIETYDEKRSKWRIGRDRKLTQEFSALEKSNQALLTQSGSESLGNRKQILRQKIISRNDDGAYATIPIKEIAAACTHELPAGEVSVHYTEKVSDAILDALK